MRSKTYAADWLDHLSAGIDLRHKQSTPLTDAITTRAQHLRGQDRALVLAMYRDNQSAAQIARLADIHPRQVRRRIKAALARLADPTFIFVVTHQSSWSSTRRKVSQSLFQSGHSIRQTADDLDLKVHQVRRHRAAILEQFAAISTPSPNRAWQYPKRTNTAH